MQLKQLLREMQLSQTQLKQQHQNKKLQNQKGLKKHLVKKNLEKTERNGDKNTKTKHLDSNKNGKRLLIKLKQSNYLIMSNVLIGREYT